MDYNTNDAPSLLVVETLYASCHKKLIDVMLKYAPRKWYTLITIPTKKWNCQRMTSALYMSSVIPLEHDYEILICSSILPLPQLIDLRPDLGHLHKFIYIHDSDLKFKISFNEIVISSFIADQIIFNSDYTKHKFIKLLKREMKNGIRVSYNNDKNESNSELVFFPEGYRVGEIYLNNIYKVPKKEMYLLPEHYQFNQALYRVFKRHQEPRPKYRVLMMPPSEVHNQYLTSRILNLEDDEEDVCYYISVKRVEPFVDAAHDPF